MLRTLILSLSFLSGTSFANYYCSGKVIHLGSGTRLTMSNGHGIHSICSLQEDTCKFWGALITTAKVADKSITVYYLHPSVGGDQSNGECKNIGNWVTPKDTVYYVQLN